MDGLLWGILIHFFSVPSSFKNILKLQNFDQHGQIKQIYFVEYKSLGLVNTPKYTFVRANFIILLKTNIIVALFLVHVYNVA